MKKAVSIWAFSGGINGDKPIIEAAKAVQQEGFDALEVSFDEKGILSQSSTVTELKELGRAIKHSGAQICSMSTIMLSKMNLISTNLEESNYAKSMVIKMIEAAALLEIPSISLHCSSSKVCQGLGYDNAVEKELQAITFLANRAKELGVLYCIENYTQGLLSSPMDFCEFLDKINNDNVGVCFDTANSVFAGHPQRWIDKLGTRIKKVHFADVKIRSMRGMVVEYVDPGKGEIDWEATVKNLNNINYSGFITVEAFATPNQEDGLRLKSIKSFLDTLIK